MATWDEFATASPDLAAAVRQRFEAHLHHILGTLMADGSPRLSGTEARFHDGELWLGCMPASRKGKDLLRDPRFALHSAPIDAEMGDGDAKLSGTVSVVTDERRIAEWLFAIGHGPDPDESTEPDGTTADIGEVLAFVCDIGSATLITLAGDHLDVTTWTPSGGLVVQEAR